MKNPAILAFPSAEDATPGMTYFEYAAVQAMQGILASGSNPTLAATEALEAANALIEKMPKRTDPRY